MYEYLYHVAQQILSHVLQKHVFRELSFFTGRGGPLFGRGQDYLGWFKGGGAKFFIGSKRGAEFFVRAKGEQNFLHTGREGGPIFFRVR